MMASDLTELYREVLLEHARSTKHRRRLIDPTLEYRGSSPLCGDEVELALRIEGDRLVEIAITGRGCAISQASGSIMAELVEGCRLTRIITSETAVKRMLSGDGAVDEDLLGDAAALHNVRRFPRRVACATLPWTTLHEALELYQRRAGS